MWKGWGPIFLYTSDPLTLAPVLHYFPALAPKNIAFALEPEIHAVQNLGLWPRLAIAYALALRP